MISIGLDELGLYQKLPVTGSTARPPSLPLMLGTSKLPSSAPVTGSSSRTRVLARWSRTNR